jgi:hypothetical protein
LDHGFRRIILDFSKDSLSSISCRIDHLGFLEELSLDSINSKHILPIVPNSEFLKSINMVTDDDGDSGGMVTVVTLTVATVMTMVRVVTVVTVGDSSDSCNSGDDDGNQEQPKLDAKSRTVTL